MTNPPPNTRLRLRYCKDEVLQYTGHRDLLRFVMRLLHQAEIPFARSGGFSPKPKVHFGPALPLGVLAENELVDIELEPGSTCSPAELSAAGQRLTEAAEPRRFVAGLELLPGGSPSLAQCTQRGRYLLAYPDNCESLIELLSAESLPTAHKGKVVDMRLAIHAWRVEGHQLHLDANAGVQPVLNIVRLADYLETHAGLAAMSITRLCLLDIEGRPL